MKYSIIIPVHNEEKFLALCLVAIKESAKIAEIDYEIITVLNRCTDQSKKIAEDNDCLIVFNDVKNLSQIRNTGIEAAVGDVVVTIDADSLMSENLLSLIDQAMRSGRYLAGGCLILADRYSLGIILSLVAIIPFLGFGTRLVGCCYAKAEAVKAISGFNPELYSAEDVDFSKRIKKYAKEQGQKYRNIYSGHIITSTRKFDHFGDWFAFKSIPRAFRLLRGKKSKEADELWYDFKR